MQSKNKLARFASFVMIVALIVSPAIDAARACIGEEKIEISFIQDQNLIAVLKTEAGTRQVEDDTGYVGMQLAVVHLVKLKSPEIDRASNERVINFLRMRIGALQKALRPYKDRVPQVNSALDELLAMASGKGTIEKKALSSAFRKLDQALRSADVRIAAASRDGDSGEWGPERPVSQLKLPSLDVARSTCNQSIDRFNTSPMQGRSSGGGLPSFQTVR